MPAPKTGGRAMEKRLRTIADRVQKEGMVKAKDLAYEFGVSMETIRKDLARLERDGIVRREYGQAILATNGMERTLDFRPRPEAKEAIGREIVRRLIEFHTILLDSSSTIQTAANGINRLPAKDIFTNSLPLASMLNGQTHCVFVLPGRKRSKNESLIGPWTEEYLEKLHVDVCVLGSSGVLNTKGPTCHSYTEISTKRAMIECSDFVIVALDAGKFAENGLHTYASWDEVDAVITDRKISKEMFAFLMDHVDVWIAQDE